MVAGGNPNQPFGNLGARLSSSQNPQYQALAGPILPFLEILNLIDLSKLMKDHVHHNLTWPLVPIKLPSDIPKFEGKTGEDMGNHVTTFHLLFSSISLNDDSIQLRLYQYTLTRFVVKWYIEFLIFS